MESLRIEKKDVYTIEVNDKGETIEFDLLDIELPDKIMKAYKDLQSEVSFVSQKEFAIRKQYKNNEKVMHLKIHELEKEYFKKCRMIFDGFLGEGACEKIFGKTNRLGMFDDLLKQLEPHLNKIQINMEQIKKNILDKYSPNNKKVI